MNLPNLTTATAAEIIDHEKRRADEMFPVDSRDLFLSERLTMVIEKLVAQRDRLTGNARGPGW